jgi:hypothetical protein
MQGMMGRTLGVKVFILFAVLCAIPLQLGTEERTDQARLAAILKKSAEYCRRLEQAALDFVCFEEVTEETVHFTRDTKVYLYDYQFIRKNQQTQEKRNLIAVDGRKTKSRESSLQTVMFLYENVLFGPVGLLSESRQLVHDYKLIGEDKIGKEKAVVIEATPRQEIGEPHLYGKIWVKEDDGSVLKIVWDQRSLRNYKMIEEFAKSQGAEPLITAFSEYGREKNGLRFPSRNYSEQGYILSGKRKIANARISVVYKKYKFFTVETNVDFK